jgi:1-deoxy-D-xylulose-5-phosphate reductoisomerase
VTLTASGGPFRTWARDRIESATPAEALKHPTWNMGAKVTVDCASLMNKALELVEAHWLFGLESSRLAAIVHPQSIVHAIVEFESGGALAHLAPTDMRYPIQHALLFPHSATPIADAGPVRTLEFEEPDLERFPALALGGRAIDAGGTAGALLNAANEEAVKAFLSQQRPMPFGAIARVVARAAEEIPPSPLNSLDDVRRAEDAARAFVRAALEMS